MKAYMIVRVDCDSRARGTLEGKPQYNKAGLTKKITELRAARERGSPIVHGIVEVETKTKAEAEAEGYVEVQS